MTVGDVISELLSALGGALPRRIGTLLVAWLLVVCGLAFFGASGWVAWDMLHRAPRLPSAMASVMLAGLAALCFRLSRKGFRATRADPSQRG